MNIRIAKLKLGINSLTVEELNKATQADKNTHFLEISFDDTIITDGYSLLVMFKLPYPSKEVVVEEIASIVRENQQVILPNVCLKSSGKLNIEFALKKAEEVITVNKSLAIEVIRTINGTYFSGIAGEELQKTIDEQITEIKELLANLGDIQTGFNENAQNKTDEFNRNVVTKTEGFNENVNNKTTLFNQNSTTKTNEFNTLVENSKSEIEDKATESANTASTEANKQVVAQQEKSIQAVQEAGTSAVESINTTKTSAIEAINSTTETVVKSVTDEGTKQAQAVQTQGNATKQEVANAGTSAASSAIRTIESTRDEAIRYITESTNTVVGAVTTEGTKQIKAVGDKALEEIEKVTQAGTDTVTSSQEQITQVKNTAISEMEIAKNEKIQEIRDIKYVDINTNQQFRDWIGTQEEYEGIILKTPETRYNIYDDNIGDTTLKFFRGKHPTSYYDSRISRIIQADNGKLTSWDKLGNMPIKREGNLPLNDYIVAQGDWGTIYSDGIVRVEQLAPTTNSDYQIALSQLEEIQNSGVSMLNEEGYTPFDFNSLTDHKVLIDDINNANVTEINNTEYPILYTNEETGETITIEEPVLKEGTIPTPISFGCLVTSDNRIYTGIGYENYGKTVKNGYGMNNVELVNNEKGVSKYKMYGTVASYKGLCYVINQSNDGFTFPLNEYINCKVRVTYNGNFLSVKPTFPNSNANQDNIKVNKEKDGWYRINGYIIVDPLENQKFRSIALTSSDLVPDTVINDLFLEIDDNSFMYTVGHVELPTIPQGMIVPNCNFEFSVPVDLVENSIIIKGIEHIPSTAQSSSWLWQSQKNLYLVNKSKNSSLYSSTYKDNNLLQNEYYFNNFKFHTSSVDEKNIKTFQQLLIYNGDLTQTELEAERDKNIKMYEIYKNE